MKKLKIILTLTIIIAGFGQVLSQPLQYFMQRSTANIASMSEVESLQMFFAGAHSLVGFEGAPKNIAIDVSSPIRSASNSYRSRRYHHASTQKNYVGGSLQHESFGAHSYLQATLGYNYRLIVSDNASLTLGVGGGVNSRNSDYGKLNNEAAHYSKKEISFAHRVGIRFEVEKLNVAIFNSDKNYMGEIVWGRLWNNQRLSNDRNRRSSGFGNERDGNWYGQFAVLFCHNTEWKTSVVRFSVNAVYKDGFSMGLSYQTDKDLSANVSLRLTKSLRIGYAYQLMHSNPIAKKHEIVARYQIVRWDVD